MEDAGKQRNGWVKAVVGSGRPLAWRPRRAPPVDSLSGVAAPYSALEHWTVGEDNGPLGRKITMCVECDANMAGRGEVRHGRNNAGTEEVKVPLQVGTIGRLEGTLFICMEMGVVRAGC